MTIDTNQKYPKNVEADANMLLLMKQRDKFNKGHDDMAIPDVEEVSHVSIYLLL